MSAQKTITSTVTTSTRATLSSDDNRCTNRPDQPLTDRDSRHITPPAHTSICDDRCQENHPPKPSSGSDVLEYVLRSAPTNSLRDLSECVTPDILAKAKQVNEGGSAIIYRVSLSISGEPVDVAIKHLNLNGKVIKNFAKELRIASRLSHRNTLKALGYVYGEETQMCYIVSEWMNKGSLRSLMKYLSPTESLEMAVGIAEGLNYLHCLAVVHADIKTDNVLVSSEKIPVLADFGLSRVKESCYSKGYYSTVTIRTSIRWRAFEYYDHSDKEIFRPNQKTDVWAFGMAMLELITCDVPYAHICGDEMVICRLVKKKLPDTPTINESETGADVKLKMLLICNSCWTENVEERPLMHYVLKKLSAGP